MTESATDGNRRVKNQLFNVAVTGGTLEEFSQSALIFPVQETVAVADTTPSETTATSTSLPALPSQVPENINVGHSPFEQELAGTLQLPSENSQLSSVFSSFSNILNFKGSSPVDHQPFLSSAAGCDSIIGQNYSSTKPQPLFPASAPIFTGVPLANPPPIGSVVPNANVSSRTAPPSVPQGSSSLYRRTGVKKPIYAPIPGLSRTAQHTPAFSDNLPPTNPYQSSSFQPEFTDSHPVQNPFYTTPNFTPSLAKDSPPGSTFPHLFEPLQNAIYAPRPPLPTSASSPELTSSFNLDQESTPGYKPPNPFPAFPPPKTFLPADTKFSTTASQYFSGVGSSSSSILSPVMAEVPASEVPASPPIITTTTVPTANAASNAYYPERIQSPSKLANTVYRPVYHHWFHKKEIEGRTIWQPFSMIDSLLLEDAFISIDISPDKVVPTDGGRYDVNILRRERFPVYWTSAPNEVRRCSWFHKGSTDGRFVPYEENIATQLEEEFKIAFEANVWHKRVELPNGDTVVFHGPDVLVLFPPTQSPDAWGNPPQSQPRPKVVKRGMDEFDIDEGEPAKVDHLLFLVHGIGSVCDLKFRTVEEVVDEFRSLSLQLVRSHYRNSCDNGIAHKVEVLPISWHSQLHSEETGVDQILKNITLESIPRLRDFANTTLLDVLFYTSPVFCQTIIATVGNELNRIYDLFKKRNPTFKGGVSLGGHSLGALIVFDLLCHQHPEPEKPEKSEVEVGGEDIITPLKPHPKHRRLTRRISYMMTEAGTGQPQLHYPHLFFNPTAFFALGSPIGMFVTVRGLQILGEEFALPTCSAFFNIFHPYDPVAYRMESLINPKLAGLQPVLIPHHKGRKRMHLELKETMVRVGADLKQKVIDSMKNTWNSFFQIALFSRQENAPAIEAEVGRAIEKELAEEEAKLQAEDNAVVEEEQKTDLSIGILNKGRRIDYVLQEAPFEFFNEYIFALTSHVCYWESEDTMLMILKEIYGSMNISADCQIPQQSMTIERPSRSPSPRPKMPQNNTQMTLGCDPTAPMTSTTVVGPPPTSGFVKKT